MQCERNCYLTNDVMKCTNYKNQNVILPVQSAQRHLQQRSPSAHPLQSRSPVSTSRLQCRTCAPLYCNRNNPQFYKEPLTTVNVYLFIQSILMGAGNQAPRTNSNTIYHVGICELNCYGTTIVLNCITDHRVGDVWTLWLLGNSQLCVKQLFITILLFCHNIDVQPDRACRQSTQTGFKY